MMRKVAATVVHEVRRMLPPTIFFLVSLNLLVLTVMLLSDGRAVGAVSFAVASVGALLIGKAVLLADMLPCFERSSGRPLIYMTLWKASLYLAMAMALHLVERIVTLTTHGDAAAAGIAGAFGQIEWRQVLVVHLWLAILLVLFVAFREAVRVIGPARIHEMFFARPAPSELATPAAGWRSE